MVGTNDYHAILVHFMTFTNGIAYAKDHQFVQDELAPLTPDDVARWMTVCGRCASQDSTRHVSKRALHVDSSDVLKQVSELHLRIQNDIIHDNNATSTSNEPRLYNILSSSIL
jgi:hypothetical protein